MYSYSHGYPFICTFIYNYVQFSIVTNAAMLVIQGSAPAYTRRLSSPRAPRDAAAEAAASSPRSRPRPLRRPRAYSARPLRRLSSASPRPRPPLTSSMSRPAGTRRSPRRSRAFPPSVRGSAPRAPSATSSVRSTPSPGSRRSSARSRAAGCWAR